MRLGSLVLALAAGTSWAAAQNEAGERDRKLQGKVDALSGEVGKALGVEFKAKVPAAYQTRDEFARRLRKKIAEEYPPEKVEADTLLLRLLGLVPKDFDLLDTIVSLMKTQAGAYYDPEEKRMFVLAGDLPDAMLGAYLFHELVHALQDQEHDLAGTMKALEKGDNGDASGGYRFLVEGEASFWMQVHMLKGMGQSLETLPPGALDMAFGMTKNLNTKGILQLMEKQEEMTGDSMPEMKESVRQLKETPPILVRALTDPYLRGMYAAHKVHQKKGAEGFRALFRDPPPWNTRDFMFGDEWIRSPRGVALVRLAPLGEALGEGWRKAGEDTIGALTIHAMLEDQKGTADAVAKAWDGDRVQVWRRGDRAFVAGVASFASPEAASSFVKQLERLYREQWTKGGKIEEAPGDGTRLACGEDRFWAWTVGGVAAFTRGEMPGDGSGVIEALRKSEVAEPNPVEKR